MFEVLFGHWPVCHHEIIYHRSAVLSPYYLFATIFSSEINIIIICTRITTINIIYPCLYNEITMVPSLSELIINI
jgi:hypothetical protein